jgi:D-amino peptidase
VCREGRELLGDGLTTVEVKEGLGAQAARMLSPKRARELIEDGAKRALADLMAVSPYDPGKPCEIKVEYKGTTPPRRLRFQPGVDRLDDRTIVSHAEDWWTAWKQFFFAAD